MNSDRHCLRHNLTYSRIEQCGPCRRAMPAVEAGLIERPEWWRVVDEGLRCDVHERTFMLDEACRACIDEDNERDD